MCGIAVYLSLNFKSREDIFLIMLEALEILQNRGYDSMGIGLGTTTPTRPFMLFRTVSTTHQPALEQMKKIMAGSCEPPTEQSLVHKKQYCPWGMGHTRWATHGSRTLINTHPHHFVSYTGWCIALVHNGIIENYTDLENEYYPARSETDSEHIVLRLAQLLDGITYALNNNTQNNNTSPLSSFPYGDQIPQLIGKTQDLEPSERVYAVFKYLMDYELKGTWAIVCHISHPQYKRSSSLFISKNGSPLLLGYNDQHEIFVASEQAAFQKYNPHWLNLPDMCTIQVNKKQKVQTDIHTWLDLTEYVPKSNGHANIIHTSPAPYTYWTEKEIVDQNKTLWEVHNRGGRVHENTIKLGGLDMHRRELLALDHLVLIGCGTSYYACLWGLRMLRQWTGMKTVQAMDASELEPGDLPHHDGKVGVVVVSQSGETRDCIRVLDELQQSIDMSIGIVNVVGSFLTTKTDCGIYLNAGREWGVASTKSFTAQTVALTLLGLWFAQHRKTSMKIPSVTQKLVLLPQQFKHHMLPIRNKIREHIIPHLCESGVTYPRSMFILGRAWSYPIALEGALKIKELAYIHTEGFPGGGLKHGPFALIEEGTPIFVLMFDGPYYSRMASACQEIALRGAHVIAITNHPTKTKILVDKKIVRDTIYIEEDEEWVASLISVLVFQWLALEWSVRQNHNPDFPRHLAKVVTVDG